MRRSVLSSCLSTAFAVTLLPLSAPVATAADAESSDSLEYVALGDSYASGVGTGDYIGESGDCRRSELAYPSLAAAEAGAESFAFAACAGAETADVLDGQLTPLSRSTDVVTVSVGGNDAGFVPVVTSCATGGDQACDDAVTEAENYAAEQLPGQLADTYDAIAAKAPEARVGVVGYPRLFELGACLSPLSEFERQRLNEAAETLNRAISEQARAAGFTFLDVEDDFEGHGACGAQPWINGVSYPVGESYHPNAAGHERGMLPSVVEFLSGAQRTSSVPPSAS
ncbi:MULTISPECIES: SGNH/GDSL hydrolase family protein [unclassified Actinopolyspora]|uniref:GDSL-type esterase/lipase family protein n=1 Tax=unclassified Actinopolyspora TaxID=2639451 RepID=UPI0013F66EA6|nr:SGNH/GDSL hydrolase family protein [Actinopolyspora sp. BKK2]NHE76812.1 SGNH/GDSL hydrolase family protein [Actinopolyspora sp. BKK1]